ncbi:hypothetical protein HPB52_014697 [Rhipicephalus sanguineus]|uniref:Uncharacterized protein n=1 Tax=Rhipicephalus sanguineus TaxID=34632 RepID=A0A9D4PRT6_RHISA|nr:hypothetical protein HPB52_014697 [Rhipicephalus sanguineus]
MEGSGNKAGARRQNSKNRRKECKEQSAFVRIKEDDAPRCSRSLDSLTCGGTSATDRDNCSGNRRAQKNQRHGRHQQRRPSVQSEAAAGEHEQDRSNVRGSRRGKNPNNKNNGRKGQRRLRRSASSTAAERDDDKSTPAKSRQPVRRTSSEGPRPRSMVTLREGHEIRRTGSYKRDADGGRSGSRSTLASGDCGVAQWNNGASNRMPAGTGGRLLKTTSLTELFAVEVGLAPAAGLTHKESRRRRIVFAVVLVALALLTASVLLVAITLFLSPTVDEVRKYGLHCLCENFGEAGPLLVPLPRLVFQMGCSWKQLLGYVAVRRTAARHAVCF